MSSFPVVGTISCNSTIAEFEWVVPNTFFIRCFSSESWDSPPFYYLKAEWCLRMNLLIPGDLDYWKGLYLVVRNPTSCYSVTFTIDIKHLKEPCHFGPETRTFDKINTFHGKEKFFQRRNIKPIHNHDNLVIRLVFYCEDKAATGVLLTDARHYTSFKSTTVLCSNFQDLLRCGRNSDVTIVVRGQEFKAHKAILGARSPVFAAMFEHDMAENKENVVKVEDCNPDTFQDFLLCVYAGSVDSLSVDKAIRLYIVSHKYSVTDVMGKCTDFLEEAISEETVCDVLALAKRYNETGLKNSAEEFLAKNVWKIFNTNSWNTWLAESSLLQKYS